MTIAAPVANRNPLALGWPALAGVVLLALVLRMAAFNGAFGSDDDVYWEVARDLAHGHFPNSSYNGALRFGFNLPAAGLMAVFGDGMFAANLWPLLCSLAEVALVGVFAAAVLNRRAGIIAALLLATAPLHMAVATRIHADSVVALFETLSFVLLFFALRQQRKGLFFAAGLSIGAIFWAKELAAVTWFAFLPLLWWFRGRWADALPVLGGVLLMMALHGLLMQAVYGNPLHLISAVLAAVKHNFVEGGDGEDAAGYYLRYLFLDVRHTGLIGFLAVAAFFVVPRALDRVGAPRRGLAFAATWFLALLLVLSLFPVSLSPLKFTMKQSNYISLFLAPMAVLAGLALAAMPARLGALLTAAALLLGALLGFLQQADYHVFTANSKAVPEVALGQPGALIVGSTKNKVLGRELVKQLHPGEPSARIADFGDVVSPAAGQPLLVVFDRETIGRSDGKPPKSPLPCWEHVRTLEPQDLGLGNRLASLLAVGPAAGPLGKLARPSAADLYRVPGGDLRCGTP